MAGQVNRALIGYTGFVGSTLLAANPYEMLFNSRNIESIRGQHFSSVTCAGVSAVKWMANKEPEQDRAAIENLVNPLKDVTADRFILISTVDVYPDPNDVTESDVPDTTKAQPYGRHRRQLEEWVLEKFENVLIVRLPALFGAGLKKNVIFDLMNLNQTENINPNGVFQWYPMRRFASDLALLDASGQNVVNVAVEPVATADIASKFFPDVAIGSKDSAPVGYDMKTRFPELLGGKGDYHVDRHEVFRELGLFTGMPS
ncbi:NAD-dependent epimerase/dehydratase family protein [Neorhizobium alkalisoli]|uniref:NAD-dependent epimerase/dehydratase domain-containing protein n=1 Tax=Neorhizobium alkalisoli TaxID=528178 RepID=A0A561R3F3_9HYPH|nr:NAD-dependent epimerase/dehydratase family protein [Neorhizobium alkalisoli]TWF57158.1 hypothetical protein FHW37_102799 [Neorhizobium alkalisoli]